MSAFAISLPQTTLDDLRERLLRVRWPSGILDGDDWRDGPDPEYLRQLVVYWRDRFNWRVQEQVLNRMTHVRVDVQGVLVHAVHLRGRGPRPLPLILTHGWPSTFAEFYKVVGLLADPGAHGGDPADAFDVIVPSLPGYGFSEPLPSGEYYRLPEIWVSLMQRLGYSRFAAHGGDIGGYITNRLAVEFPDRLVGIHITYPAEPHVDSSDDLSDEERRFVAARPRGRELGGAYAHIHRTRPLTLAYGLADSPLGLAAWILDKWREWSDCNGVIERRFTRDELLTTVTLYWATGTIDSSLQVYREWGLGSPPQLAGDLYPLTPLGVEPRPLHPGQRIDVPAGVALFHVRYPRRFVERAYADLRRWSDMPRGGHFPALEEPALLVDDIRALFRSMR